MATLFSLFLSNPGSNGVDYILPYILDFKDEFLFNQVTRSVLGKNQNRTDIHGQKAVKSDRYIWHYRNRSEPAHFRSVLVWVFSSGFFYTRLIYAIKRIFLFYLYISTIYTFFYILNAQIRVCKNIV